MYCLSKKELYISDKLNKYKMNIELSNTDFEQTTTGFEYGVLHKYNVISSAKNIQYKIKWDFTID
jgi:hypothetical protein